MEKSVNLQTVDAQIERLENIQNNTTIGLRPTEKFYLACLQKLFALLADDSQSGVVPEGWDACSPEWIERNGPCSCAEAPRIAFGEMGNHFHPHIYHNPAQGTVVGEVVERPCQGEMNLGRTYKKVRGLAEMEDMPVGTKFYAVAPTTLRDSVRVDHATWSDATFGSVGPVGPLKHLSKEALEAAADPGDLSEWADMQFLLWDAQRRAGITDEQVTQAMVEKLEVNKARHWPAPQDGEPRLHIKGE